MDVDFFARHFNERPVGEGVFGVGNRGYQLISGFEGHSDLFPRKIVPL